MDVRVLTDPSAVAAAAAERAAAALTAAIAERGEASLIVSGGRSPVECFQRLAAMAAAGWNHVGVWFADERAVAPDDPQSNYRLVREALVEPGRIPAANVRRMEAERADLDAAARDYEQGLPRRPDLMILGIGEDGHVASIFPGGALVAERTRRVAVVRDSPKPPPVRMSVTPPVLREARGVLVLATGAGKAEAVAAALAPEGDAERTPARLLRERTWFVDRAAAARLRGGSP